MVLHALLFLLRVRLVILALLVLLVPKAKLENLVQMDQPVSRVPREHLVWMDPRDQLEVLETP